MTDTTSPVVTQLAALTVEARRIADALTAPLPGEDGLPVSTCPRTDRHGYHMWADADRTAICPGHPAPPPVDVAAAMTGVTPGGNAEDCPRCTGTNPDYPFLCPGHPSPDAARTTPETPPTSGDGRPDGEGLRGLLEHVGIDLTGKTVTIADGPTIAQMHADNARTTPDNPVASSSEAQECSEDTTRHAGTSTIGERATPGRATITIAVTAPNQDNANRWASTIRDLVTAEHGHHMRLDITIGDGEADDGLRERVAAAIRAQAETGNVRYEALADTVLAVRDDELAEWRDLAKSALKEVEQQTARADDAEVAIARARSLADDIRADATQMAGTEADNLRIVADRLAAALDGPAGAEPSPDGDTCRPLEINGDTIRVHGSRDLTDQERSYASDIVDAAKRRFAAEQAQPTDRPRCPDCGLPHNLTPGSRPMSLCQRTRDRIASEPDPVQAQPELQQRRADGDAARLDAIDRTEHATLNRHHLRPTKETP